MQEFGQPLLVPNFPKDGLSLFRPGNKDVNERDLERDGWWRTISACLAMIKHAGQVIEQSNQIIADQKSRIALLEQQATVDELTGLMNRRGFFDAFRGEMDRTNRGFSEGGLFMVIDLDNFKMINDTYGHQAGDAALRLVGKTLSADSRAMDACARLGGDEFVLLLANTDREKSLARAQNMIKRLNSLSLVWYGAEIPVRASLGLKDYKAGDSIEEIFGEADTKLYTHKRNNKSTGISQTYIDL